MSIRELIHQQIRAGELFLVRPSVEGDPIERNMFVSSEVHKLLVGPWESEEEEKRCNQLKGDLDHFITGGRIGVCLGIRKHQNAYMARLDRDGAGDDVWEIRSADPKPGIRIFGRFAEIDTFIGLTWWQRKLISNPRQWALRKRECKAAWNRLLLAYQPHSGENASDYISEKFFSI